MKIGLVRRGHSSTGGAEAYLIRFAAEARRLGHDPVLITNGEWPQDRWIGTEIIRLEGRTPVEFSRAVQSARTGCDLLFSLERVPGCEVFRAGDGVHAAWLRRRDGFETFWKRITRWTNPKHRQLLRLEKEIFEPSVTRAVIANSRMVRDEITRHFDFPADRIHVVYNGLTSSTAPPPERSAARRQFGIEETAFCPLFLGTGWERKGLATAIEAVEMTEDCRLLVAGRGPADLYSSASATFLGPVREIASLFAAADVLIAPTWYDPFSNACLEALAAGLPVLTTDANGFAEILEPGVHGEIIPAGDALAFAEALDRWKVPGRAESARAGCMARAAEFSIERNAVETLGILSQVAAVR